MPMLELSFGKIPRRPRFYESTPRNDALGTGTIVFMILQFMPSAGLVARARAVSTLWWIAGCRVLRELQRVHAGLSQFVPNVPALRRVMCEMDGIIAGPFALNLFRPLAGHCGPSAYLPLVLHLFFEEIFEYQLVDALRDQGYRLVRSKSTAPGVSRAAYREVMRFARGNRRIEVYLTWVNPVHCVLMSETAAMMNFVTWDAAYCMFPRDLLLLHRAVLWDLSPCTLPRLLNAVSDLGVQSYNWVQEPVMPKSFRRWVGDAGCWKVDLETATVMYDGPGYDGDSQVIPSQYLWEVNHLLVQYTKAPTCLDRGNLRYWKTARNCLMLDNTYLLYSYAVAEDFMRLYFNQLDGRDLDEDDRVDAILPGVKLDRLMLDS